MFVFHIRAADGSTYEVSHLQLLSHLFTCSANRAFVSKWRRVNTKGVNLWESHDSSKLAHLQVKKPPLMLNPAASPLSFLYIILAWELYSFANLLFRLTYSFLVHA